jgi:hypothetical protein
MPNNSSALLVMLLLLLLLLLLAPRHRPSKDSPEYVRGKPAIYQQDASQQ